MKNLTRPLTRVNHLEILLRKTRPLIRLNIRIGRMYQVNILKENEMGPLTHINHLVIQIRKMAPLSRLDIRIRRANRVNFMRGKRRSRYPT